MAPRQVGSKVEREGPPLAGTQRAESEPSSVEVDVVDDEAVCRSVHLQAEGKVRYGGAALIRDMQRQIGAGGDGIDAAALRIEQFRAEDVDARVAAGPGGAFTRRREHVTLNH